MTDKELQEGLSEIAQRLDTFEKEIMSRVEDLENEREAIKNLPASVAAQVATLAGKVDTLQDIVLQGFNSARKSIQIQDSEGNPTEIRKESPIKNAVQFSAVILVPLLVALIGLYAVTHVGK